MHKLPLVLLIHNVSSDVESMRQLLSEREGFRLQCVTRLSAALARLAGGGVDAIILYLSPSERMEAETLESFFSVHGAAPQLPIITISDSDGDALLSLTRNVGASASLTKQQCAAGLKSLVSSLTGRREVTRAQVVDLPKTGAMVTVLGSKGGVGATTVALNVACVLAQNHRVILGEMRPALGTLSRYFRAPDKVRDLTSLLGTPPDAVGTTEIEACLWPYRNTPGLRILFGPQSTDRYSPIGFDHAKTIAKGLKTLADYVVIDLPSMPSDANCAVIEASECLALVVERDPVCLDSARLMLQTITSWGSAPQSMGIVIVNREPLAAPVPLEEFETRLGIPIFAVIPPAADVYIAAQRANRPLVAFDGEGLAATSLVDLAKLLSELCRPLQLERKLVTR